MLFNTNTNPTNSQDAQVLEKSISKERVKASFSVLDHFVKIYNYGDTYIKRGLTLLGLGSILAGATFGGGQQLPSSQQNNSVERSPSIIYVQVPTQSASAPVKLQPSARVPQQAVARKILTKSTSVQRKTATPVRINSAANRTIVNPKPTSKPTTVRPLAKVPQRVTTQKIVRAKSAPVTPKAKTPVRPVSRATRKVATNTPKQIRGAIKEATSTVTQVKQAIAPLRATNKNN